MQIVERRHKKYLRKGFEHEIESAGAFCGDVELAKRQYLHATTTTTAITTLLHLKY